MANGDPIKELYNIAKKTNAFLDENDFREQLKKDSKGLYSFLSGDKATKGIFLDYDDFETTLGVKKNGSSDGLGRLLTGSDLGVKFPTTRSPYKLKSEEDKRGGKVVVPEITPYAIDKTPLAYEQGQSDAHHSQKYKNTGLYEKNIQYAKQERNKLISVSKESTKLAGTAEVFGRIMVDRESFILEQQGLLDAANNSIKNKELYAQKTRDDLNPTIKKHIDYIGKNYKKYTGLSGEGDEIPSVYKIDEFATEIANRYGLPHDSHFRKLIKNEAINQVQFEIAKPKAIKIAENALKAMKVPTPEQWASEEKNKTDKLLIKEKTMAQMRVDQIAEGISKERDDEKAIVSTTFEDAAKNIKAEYQAAIPLATSQEQLDALFEGTKEKLNGIAADYILAQNTINSRYNAQYKKEQERVNAAYKKNADDIIKKFGATEMSPQHLKQLEIIYGAAFQQALHENQQFKDKRDENLVPKTLLARLTGMNAGINLMRTYYTSLGGAVKGVSSTFGLEAGVLLGEHMSMYFQHGTTELKSFWDLFDATKLSKSTGSLLGSMTPSLIASAGVAAATGGTGAPAMLRMFASSLAAWGSETADLMGRMYEDMFAKTGNAVIARKAATETFKSQVALMPAYALEGLPFFGKSIRLAKTLGGRILAGGTVELVTEWFQEYPQNLFEEAIKRGDPFIKGLNDMSVEGGLHTALQIAPVFLLGAGGQVSGSLAKAREQEQIMKAANSLAAKDILMGRSKGLREQYLFDMMQRRGDVFTKAYIGSLFSGGVIEESEALELVDSIKNAKDIISRSEKYGLTPAEQKIYAAMTFKMDELKKSVSAETDPILVKASLAKIETMEDDLVKFVSGEKTDYVVITTANNEQYVLTPKEAESFMDAPNVQVMYNDGNLLIETFGKRGAIQERLDEFDKTKKKNKDAFSRADDEYKKRVDEINYREDLTDEEKQAEQEKIMEEHGKWLIEQRRKESGKTVEQSESEVAADMDAINENMRLDTEDVERRIGLLDIASPTYEEDKELLEKEKQDVQEHYGNLLSEANKKTKPKEPDKIITKVQPKRRTTHERISDIEKEISSLYEREGMTGAELSEASKREAELEEEKKNLTDAINEQVAPIDEKIKNKEKEIEGLYEKEGLSGAELKALGEKEALIQKEINQLRKERALARKNALEGTPEPKLSPVVVDEDGGKVSEEKGEVIGEHKGVKVYSTTNVDAFHEAISGAVKARTTDKHQVDVHPKEYYQKIIDTGGQLFLSADNQFGGYVQADGYVGSLFRNPESKEKGVGGTIIKISVERGGKFFDAYATYLEKLYIKNGFRPVARLKFSEEFAPEGWNDEGSTLQTKPDVVFFAYDPHGEYVIGDGKYFENWEDAYKFARDYEATTQIDGKATGRADGTGKANVPDSQDVSQEGQSETETGREQGSKETVTPPPSKKKLSEETKKKILDSLQITPENAPEISREVPTNLREKLTRDASLVVKALKVLIPNIKITLHDTKKSFTEATGYGNEVRGGFVRATNEIHINIQAVGDAMKKFRSAKSNVVLHEGVHPILNAIYASNPEAVNSLYEQLQALSEKVRGVKETLVFGEQSKEYAIREGHTKEVAELSEKMEAIVEFISRVANKDIDLSKLDRGVLKKIADMIREFLALFGGEGIKINSKEDIVKLARQISKAFESGTEIKTTQKGETSGLPDTQLQAEGFFTGEEIAPEFKTLQEAARWLGAWSKKNKILKKDLSKASDKSIVESLIDHTKRELNAWEKINEGYEGFYDEDIPNTLNPELIAWAKNTHGRTLTGEEISLYHILSSFASPSATPVFDSNIGLQIFDKYLRTGKISAYSDTRQATVWETKAILNKKGKPVLYTKGDKRGQQKTVRFDTKVLKFEDDGATPVMAQVARAYAVDSLDNFKHVVEYFNGDIKKAVRWVESKHSYEELSKVMGRPMKNVYGINDNGKKVIVGKPLEQHENLTKSSGGFGVFALSGPKLGSYILNRVGEYGTVTKDLWYARTMARLFGEPLIKNGEVLKDPWKITVDGVRKRKLADEAWGRVAEELGVSPAVIQQRVWDFEKRLWQKLGADSAAGKASEGLRRGIEEVEKAAKLPDTQLQHPAQEQGDVESTAKALEEVAKNRPKELEHILSVGELEEYKVYQKEIQPLFDKEAAKYKGYGIIKHMENEFGELNKGVATRAILLELVRQKKGLIGYIPEASEPKALERLMKRFNAKEDGSFWVLENDVSEQYHKAKADGTNPELVKAVESLLSKEQGKPTKEQGIVEGENVGLEEDTYHGTQQIGLQEIKQSTQGFWGSGVYSAKSPTGITAKLGSRGELIPLKVRMKKPFDIRGKTTMPSSEANSLLEQAEAALKKSWTNDKGNIPKIPLFKDGTVTHQDLYEAIYKMVKQSHSNPFSQAVEQQTGTLLKGLLEPLGYDGAVYYTRHGDKVDYPLHKNESDGRKDISFVTWKSEGTSISDAERVPGKETKKPWILVQAKPFTDSWTVFNKITGEHKEGGTASEAGKIRDDLNAAVEKPKAGIVEKGELPKTQLSITPTDEESARKLEQMKEIVNDVIGEGFDTLEEVQDAIADVLGDRSREAMVEKAYNEIKGIVPPTLTSTPTQTTTGGKKLSGIKKELVSQKIIESVNMEKITDADMMDLGREIINKGHVIPEDLISAVIHGYRTVISPAEVVALIYHKTDLDNQLTDAYVSLDKLMQKGKDTSNIEGKIKKLEAQINDFEVMAVITANQQSMAFRLRKKLLDRQYNATYQISKYKSNNKGYISTEVESRMKEMEKELKELKKQIRGKEEEASIAKAQDALDNIAESVAREQAGVLTEDEIEKRIKDGVAKGIRDVYEKLPQDKKTIADKAIDAIKKMRKTIRGNNYSDVTGAVAIIDSGLTIIENAIKLGVSVAEAVEVGIKHIKDGLKKIGIAKWDAEDRYRKDVTEAFEYQGVAASKKKQVSTEITVNADGSISIPNSLLRKLVGEGKTEIEELTDAIYDIVSNQLPNITKRDIRDYITKYGEKANPTVDDIQSAINKAKRVGRLLSKLDDLKNMGRAEYFLKYFRRKTREEFIPYREAELKKQIRDLSKQIEDSGVPLTETEQGEYDKLSVAADKVRLRKSIERWKQRLADKDYAKKKPHKPLGHIRSQDKELADLEMQENALREEFENLQEEVRLKNKKWYEKAEDVALEVLAGIPRTLVASMDFSAAFVQGQRYLFTTNPTKSIHAFKTMFQHFASEKSQDAWFSWLRSQPFYPLLQQSKLAVSDTKHGKASVLEGLFYINWANIIYNGLATVITLGHKPSREFVKRLNPLKASQRAFDGFINYARVEMFLRVMDNLESQGYSPDTDPDVYKSAAGFVNTTTGRGSIGEKIDGLKWMNAVMFSAKKVMSEFKLYSPAALIYYPALPKPVRKIALLNFATFITSFVGLNAIIWAMRKDWDDDEPDDFWNPTSTDFMTHRLGDTRVGLGGGMKTMLVFWSRMVSGKFTSSMTGKTEKLGERYNKDINTRLDLFFHFMLGKLSPGFSLIRKKLAEKKGRELEGKEAIRDITVPIWMQDVRELYKTHPVEVAGMLTVLGIFGADARIPDKSKMPKEKAFDIIYMENGVEKKKKSTPEEYQQYLKGKETDKGTVLRIFEEHGVGVNKYGEITLDLNEMVDIKPYNKLSDDEKKEINKRISSKASGMAKDRFQYDYDKLDERDMLLNLAEELKALGKEKAVRERE